MFKKQSIFCSRNQQKNSKLLIIKQLHINVQIATIVAQTQMINNE
jgi:hypothetical protein